MSDNIEHDNSNGSFDYKYDQNRSIYNYIKGSVASRVFKPSKHRSSSINLSSKDFLSLLNEFSSGIKMKKFKENSNNE
ncbi:hypothetical protein A0H76_1322 [Hepatospora eriocheir]|uniref:Uncharacterized protein n=1 Tax=Hepatospora eriocheir TaxID=1081669 RepID=A0A1X0QHA5_9MICR|nr:hypothetical protein A0H76_1322 [Hepatospora eriocheir]